MPASPKSSDLGDEAASVITDAQSRFHDLAERIESLVKDGLDTLRSQSRTYAEGASESLETAQKYVVERVQERPLTATFAALGVGVVIGLLLGAGRNR